MDGCSTPFGIKDRITRLRKRMMISSLGCSTPFGIKDRITQRSAHRNRQHRGVLNAFRHQRSNHPEFIRRGWLEKEVLNAFRHQRSNHTRQAIAICRICCAQRLSASKIESLARCPQGSPRISRAQRLSASKIESQAPGRSQEALSHVLNAFRHQRSNHS